MTNIEIAYYSTISNIPTSQYWIDFFLMIEYFLKKSIKYYLAPEKMPQLRLMSKK